MRRQLGLWMVLGVSALGFVGCVTSPRLLTPVPNPSAAWKTHQAALQSIQGFSMTGKLGVSEGSRGQSLEFAWQETSPGHFTLEFFGPLGIRLGRLTQDASGVSLVTKDGTFTADTPEVLIQEQLGFSLPVTGLDRWVLGVPTRSEATVVLNSYGYASAMSESGWSITYLEDIQRGTLGFPQKIVLTRGDVRVVVWVRTLSVT